MAWRIAFVALLLVCFDCKSRGAGYAPDPTASAEHHVLASYAPGNGRFFYAGGSSGTYTVPSGAFVTGLSCHASAAGATLTMTPSGPDVTVPVAGPSIPIPVGAALAISRPLLVGSPDELGSGSILAFAGTDAYVVTLFQGGGP